MAALAEAATTALAVAVPRLRLPAIQPSVGPIRVGIPPASTNFDEFLRGSRYGTDDPVTIRALDQANVGVVNAFDATAERVAANAEARTRVMQCGGEALGAAGTSYGEVVTMALATGQQVPAPDTEQLTAATAKCLDVYFPEFPEEVVQLASELANQAAQSAQDAQIMGPSGLVLARWMTVTGTDVSSARGSGDLADTIVPQPGDGGSFPWWIVAVGGFLAAAAVCVALARRKP